MTKISKRGGDVKFQNASQVLLFDELAPTPPQHKTSSVDKDQTCFPISFQSYILPTFINTEHALNTVRWPVNLVICSSCIKTIILLRGLNTSEL